MCNTYYVNFIFRVNRSFIQVYVLYPCRIMNHLKFSFKKFEKFGQSLDTKLKLYYILF